MVVYTLEQRWEILQQIDLQKMPILAKEIIFSDEAHFENPQAYIEKSTQSNQVTVWYGFWSWGIIGLFFFENKRGDAVTVNGDCYRAMLNELKEENIGNIWFQENGATGHTAEVRHDVLRPVFEDGIISCKTDVVCSPRSLELTP